MKKNLQSIILLHFKVNLPFLFQIVGTEFKLFFKIISLQYHIDAII